MDLRGMDSKLKVLRMVVDFAVTLSLKHGVCSIHIAVVIICVLSLDVIYML